MAAELRCRRVQTEGPPCTGQTVGSALLWGEELALSAELLVVPGVSGHGPVHE